MTPPSGQGAAFFVDGGTLKPSAPSYVERTADREFLAALSSGDFCYVLTSRQMGKSSLMARTAVKLREAGGLNAIIDLTTLGEGGKGDAAVSASAWYYGIARSILRELGLKTEIKNWWQERDGLPEQQRFTEFLEEIVLKTSQPVVIFVDEIDATLRLPFTDDFFAGIRACYNARATKPAFQRLTFALLGVASPSELIKDVTRTPFNIGRRIELNDFTLEEARTLAAGFAVPADEAANILERVMHWTNGQPYLTQKLCVEITRSLGGAKTETPSSLVDQVVEEIFFSKEAVNHEVHFKYIRDRVLQDSNMREMLMTYRRVLRGEPVEDNPQSLVQNSLKLAGLVRRALEDPLL